MEVILIIALVLMFAFIWKFLGSIDKERGNDE